MEATAYESLLAKVYGARPESKGIDADMYRLMLDEYQNLITKAMYETHQERVEEFRRAFVVIRECVLQAISDGAKKVMHKASDSDIQSMELMAAKLEYDFFDRFELRQIIANCNALFSSYGLNATAIAMITTEPVHSIYAGRYGH